MSVLLKGKDDFYWYKKNMDVQGRYCYAHEGEPKEFPCKVVSEFYDDPNGPYYQRHKFIYKQKVSCDSCGSCKEVWPETEEFN